MARNHEKYVYAEMAIPRNSAWYPLLVAEAEAKGLPLAQVALERLAASYLLGSQLTSAVTVAPVSVVPRQLAPAPKPPAVGTAIEALPEGDENVTLSEERAASNAAAFLDSNGEGFF